MKAIHRNRKLAALLASAVMLGMAGSCSEPPAAVPRAAPPPPQRPVSVTPPRSLPKAPADWRDAPITPGDWRWSVENGKSTARFAGDLLVLQCDHAVSAVRLYRSGTPAGVTGSEIVPFTITTSSGTRALNGSAVAGPPQGVALAIAINDALLDAMAFSRGRFVVESAGMPVLYLPSWAEVSRVVEDCR